MIQDSMNIYKVILVGNSGVGKSQILSRYQKNEFQFDSTTTIGVEFASKMVEIEPDVFVKVFF